MPFFPSSSLMQIIGRKAGDALSLMDIREQYGSEYSALMPAEKQALVTKYESKKSHLCSLHTGHCSFSVPRFRPHVPANL